MEYVKEWTQDRRVPPENVFNNGALSIHAIIIRTFVVAPCHFITTKGPYAQKYMIPPVSTSSF